MQLDAGRDARMRTVADQLSAELDARFSAGPLNAGAIVRARDLIVCAGDPSLDVPIEEVYAHPPIGWDRHPGVDDERFGETVDAIDLGGGIFIEELDRDTAELVMNACTPRGHYFVPVRQFGQRYSFVKEVPLDELEHRHFAWDTDGTARTSRSTGCAATASGSMRECRGELPPPRPSGDVEDGLRAAYPLGRHGGADPDRRA